LKNGAHAPAVALVVFSCTLLWQRPSLWQWLVSAHNNSVFRFCHSLSESGFILVWWIRWLSWRIWRDALQHYQLRQHNHSS